MPVCLHTPYTFYTPSLAMSFLTSAYRQLTDREYRHFAPYSLHYGANFEGFYTKFVLPSGAIFIIVLCTIPHAPDPKRAHNLTITLVPRPGSSTPVWQREIFPDSIALTTDSTSRDSFSLETHLDDGEARLQATPTEINITILLRDIIDFRSQTITASSTSVPWSPRTPSPESWLRFLPLPLHWHVHTLSSPASFTLALPSYPLDARDAAGAATAHAEKNWSTGFPRAHVWLCARRADGAQLALAGGMTLGLHAFLAGIRVPARHLDRDFRPPFALGVPLPFLPTAITAPFLRFTPDWPSRTFRIMLRDFGVKVEIDAAAGDADFFEFSAPTPRGFVPATMAETMRAKATLRVWERRGASFLWALVPFAGDRGWTMVASEVFSDVALEFGGEYYTKV